MKIDWQKIGRVAKPIGIGLTILGTVVGLAADLGDLTEAIGEAKTPELPGPTSEEKQ